MVINERVTEIYGLVCTYTMIGPETVLSMYQAAEICTHEKIPGALVECGVWKGGSLMAGMIAFMELEGTNRDVYAYDTFTGMPKPESQDGADAIRMFGEQKDWCLVTQVEVEKNLATTGYPLERIKVIPGRVEDTIPSQSPDLIALLRLDTDWYSSTLHELRYLYPKLSPGGVLIIDDYGCWPGCRQATQEYFGGNIPAMTDINWTARMMRKPF